MQTIHKVLLFASSMFLLSILAGPAQAGLITVAASQQFGQALVGVNPADDPLTDVSATTVLDFATPDIAGTLQQVQVTIAAKHVLRTVIVGIDGADPDRRIDASAASLADVELELANGATTLAQPISDLFDESACRGLVACFNANRQQAVFADSFVIDEPLALAEIISSDLLFLVTSSLFTAGPVCDAEFGDNFCLSLSLAKTLGSIDVAYTFQVFEPAPLLLMILGTALLWWRRQTGLQVR